MHTVSATAVSRALKCCTNARGYLARVSLRPQLRADMLVEPLKQLVTGAPVAQTDAVADILDRVRILCSVYDPKTGQYRVNYSIFIEIAGFIMFFAYIAWFLWKERRRRKLPGA